MKKLLTLTLAVTLCFTLFACSKSGIDKEYEIVTNAIDAAYKDKTPTTKEVFDAVVAVSPVGMPGAVDDQFLKFLEFNLDDIEEYTGEYSMVNTMVDNFLIIRAKDGKVDSIKTALTKRRDDVAKSMETYLPLEYEKAKNGKIIVKGNDVILAILGDTTKYE